MIKVLYIISNPKKIEDSVSRSIANEFINELKKKNSEVKITEINLYNTTIPELDNDLLSLRNGSPITDPKLQEKVSQINNLVEQFIDADKYIFVTPLWNLGLPGRMKSYIDAVCVVGKAFRYTAQGPIGLLNNKKCLHIHSSGGFHSNDPQNHADGYLRDIMAFMGVKEFQSLIIEGHMALPNKAEEIINTAKAEIPKFIDWFS